MTIQELEQFIATYGTDIYSFCVYLTGNRPEAEELYQDTFLKMRNPWSQQPGGTGNDPKWKIIC